MADGVLFQQSCHLSAHDRSDFNNVLMNASCFIKCPWQSPRLSLPAAEGDRSSANEKQVEAPHSSLRPPLAAPRGTGEHLQFNAGERENRCLKVHETRPSLISQLSLRLPIECLRPVRTHRHHWIDLLPLCTFICIQQLLGPPLLHGDLLLQTCKGKRLCATKSTLLFIYIFSKSFQFLSLNNVSLFTLKKKKSNFSTIRVKAKPIFHLFFGIIPLYNLASQPYYYVILFITLITSILYVIEGSRGEKYQQSISYNL